MYQSSKIVILLACLLTYKKLLWEGGIQLQTWVCVRNNRWGILMQPIVILGVFLGILTIQDFFEVTWVGGDWFKIDGDSSSIIFLGVDFHCELLEAFKLAWNATTDGTTPKVYPWLMVFSALCPLATFVNAVITVWMVRRHFIDGDGILTDEHTMSVSIQSLPLFYGILSLKCVLRKWICFGGHHGTWTRFKDDEALCNAMDVVYESNYEVADLYEAYTLWCFGTMCFNYLKQQPEIANATPDLFTPLSGTSMLGVTSFVLVAAIKSCIVVGDALVLDATSGWASMASFGVPLEKLTTALYGAGFLGSSLAIYNLINMEVSLGKYLHDMNPFWKFLSVKILVSICFIQSIVFAVVFTGLNLLNKNDQDLLYSTFICFELLGVAWICTSAWAAEDDWYDTIVAPEEDLGFQHMMMKKNRIHLRVKVEKGEGIRPDPKLNNGKFGKDLNMIGNASEPSPETCEIPGGTKGSIHTVREMIDDFHLRVKTGLASEHCHRRHSHGSKSSSASPGSSPRAGSTICGNFTVVQLPEHDDHDKNLWVLTDEDMKKVQTRKTMEWWEGVRVKGVTDDHKLHMPGPDVLKPGDDIVGIRYPDDYHRKSVQGHIIDMRSRIPRQSSKILIRLQGGDVHHHIHGFLSWGFGETLELIVRRRRGADGGDVEEPRSHLHHAWGSFVSRPGASDTAKEFDGVVYGPGAPKKYNEMTAALPRGYLVVKVKRLHEEEKERRQAEGNSFRLAKQDSGDQGGLPNGDYGTNNVADS